MVLLQQYAYRRTLFAALDGQLGIGHGCTVAHDSQPESALLQLLGQSGPIIADNKAKRGFSGFADDFTR